MSPPPPGRTGNRLLDRLPEDEYNALLPSLHNVSLPSGQEIYRENGPLSHVYFPRGGMCSIVTHLEGGTVIEAATVGSEGMLGIPVLLGLEVSPVRAIARLPGECLRMPSPAFVAAMRGCTTLDRLTRRFVAFALKHAYQTIACNALHSVQERMCRWLLITHDHVGREEFPVTHEFLAEMLGVRRQTVTVLVGSLQTAGFITTRRGTVRVVNREAMEAASCECYQVRKAYYEYIVR